MKIEWILCPFAAAKRDWKFAMIQYWKTFRYIVLNANMKP